MKSILTTLITLIAMVHNLQAQQYKYSPGNNYYQTYEVNNNIICSYDILQNLTRKADLKSKIVTTYFHQGTFLKNLEDNVTFGKNLVKSKKNMEYLYSYKSFENFMTERSYIEEYQISKIGGFVKVATTSKSNLHFLEGMTEEQKLEVIQQNDLIQPLPENGSSSRTEKDYDSINAIHIYKQYYQNKLYNTLYLKFNEKNLISDLLLISTDYTKNEYYIDRSRVIYDIFGNLIEQRDWNTKNYKQFEEVLQKKEKEYFLNSLFENNEQHYSMYKNETNIYTYRGELIETSKKIQHFSNDNEVKSIYKYDNQKRLVEITTTQEGKPYEKEIFKYE